MGIVTAGAGNYAKNIPKVKKVLDKLPKMKNIFSKKAPELEKKKAGVVPVVPIDEDKIVKICNGNKAVLHSILKNLYTLSYEFMKRSVDFSTTILSFFATAAICLAQSSIYFKSAAIPFPKP